MENELTKNQLIETITDILVDVVGWIKKEAISPNKEFVRDLRIDSDDLTVFIVLVEKRFKVNATYEEWRQVGTIEQTAGLILKYLSKSDDSSSKPNHSLQEDSNLGTQPSVFPAIKDWLKRLGAWFVCWVVALGSLAALIQYSEWPPALVISLATIWIAVASSAVFFYKKE
ncbi:MAG: acyl carrier protein [Gammaproteobacteria bacterium]|nr:acyl carrier protein [Gammaproteobacteria bacterium]